MKYQSIVSGALKILKNTLICIPMFLCWIVYVLKQLSNTEVNFTSGATNMLKSF